MKCPNCGVWSLVKETRDKDSTLTRRRECANGHRFTTAEVVVVPKRGRPRSKQ